MRLTVRRALAIALGTLVVPAGACVLADPPASVPTTPLEPPEIDHELVQPPVTAILRAWPTEFVIPVVVRDPSSTVVWRAFSDYDPLAPLSNVGHGEIGPDQAGDDAGERVIVAHVPVPANPGACHTLEILVALGFSDSDPHAPDSVGGDSVSWFYSPTGSLDACPVFEGPDASTADGALEGGLDEAGSAADGASE